MRVKHSKKKKEPVIEEQSLIRTPTEEDLIIEEEHVGDWPLPPLLPQDFDVY